MVQQLNRFASVGSERYPHLRAICFLAMIVGQFPKGFGKMIFR